MSDFIEHHVDILFVKENIVSGIFEHGSVENSLPNQRSLGASSQIARVSFSNPVDIATSLVEFRVKHQEEVGIDSISQDRRNSLATNRSKACWSTKSSSDGISDTKSIFKEGDESRPKSSLEIGPVICRGQEIVVRINSEL